MLPFQWAWCLLANCINYIKLPRFHTANQQIPPQEQNQGFIQFIHGIYMAEKRISLLHLGGPEGSDLQHRTPQRGGFTDPLESLGTGHPGLTLGVGEGAKRMVSWWGVWWWGWGGCRNDSITLKYITYYFCKYLFVFFGEDVSFYFFSLLNLASINTLIYAVTGFFSKLAKPELVVRWGLGSLGLSTQVLGFEFSSLVCWNVVCVYLLWSPSCFFRDGWPCIRLFCWYKKKVDW